MFFMVDLLTFTLSSISNLYFTAELFSLKLYKVEFTSIQILDFISILL